MDPARRHRLGRAVELVAAFALAAATLAWGLPRTAGADWHAIGAVLGEVGPTTLALICGLWLAGLAVHTIALRAALPGLSHRRAFFLNITGSSVSNLLPLGGTAGTAVNWWAVRSWGFSTAAFVRWALVTNIWDVLGRLAVPGVALAWLAASGVGDGDALAGAAAGAAALLAVLIGVTAALLRGDRGALVLGRLAARVLSVLHKDPGSREQQAVAIRRSMADLIRTAWRGLTLGKALYAAFQAALLWLCLHAVGADPGLPVVFAAFAVERVLSLAVITPGAAGIVEIGMTGYLARTGTTPVDAAAGVLLYRIFVIGMEVPVGGALLLWWTGAGVRTRRRRRSLPATTDVPPAPAGESTTEVAASRVANTIPAGFGNARERR
jgi:putative heme transporter